MARTYAVTFEATAVTAAVDFFEVVPADDKPIRILGLMLSQSSDVGDAAEEILRIKIIRGHATSGSGGTIDSSVPKTPMDAYDNACGFTAETCNTTIASTGTAVDLWADAFNIRSGYQVWFPPEAQPQCSQAQTCIVVRLMAAPADSLTMSGTLIVQEP